MRFYFGCNWHEEPLEIEADEFKHDSGTVRFRIGGKFIYFNEVGFVGNISPRDAFKKCE